ncbi:hypothetical protein [Oceaniglobus trochenteri]|uniref:hypothetical protein n=1 Tax=Oceaniglobus trochenteri TaxID=2763260 RepID=UPI001CFF6397|nr:hypothetical protein [Oceaniglobus trochenteri]
MMERRAILEDALADALKCVGDIEHNDEKDRCLSIPCGTHPQTWDLHPLYQIACALERELQ